MSENRASEVLLLVRSLLRDDDVRDLRFSDRELLDCLERVQNEFIIDFRQNVRQLCIKPHYEENGSFEIDYELAYIFGIWLNENPINFGSFAMASRQNEQFFAPICAKKYMIFNHIL